MLDSLQPNDLEETVTYDVIISDGLWFDGTGSAPRTCTLGIRDGVVATVSADPLDETGCPEVIDAAGHCPHDEVPELVNRALLDWMAGL